MTAEETRHVLYLALNGAQVTCMVVELYKQWPQSICWLQDSYAGQPSLDKAAAYKAGLLHITQAGSLTCRLMYFESAVERIPTVLAVSAMSAGSLTRAEAASASAWPTAGHQHKKQKQNRLFGQSRRSASSSNAVKAIRSTHKQSDTCIMCSCRASVGFATACTV